MPKVPVAEDPKCLEEESAALEAVSRAREAYAKKMNEAKDTYVHPETPSVPLQEGKPLYSVFKKTGKTKGFITQEYAAYSSFEENIDPHDYLNIKSSGRPE